LYAFAGFWPGEGASEAQFQSTQNRCVLIVNADDWGRSRAETDAILKCCALGRVTAVSAMVFMEDSERAAAMAKEAGLDVGLHLNFSQRFTGRTGSGLVERAHARIARFLTTSRYAVLLYHPGLRKDFRCVYQAQAGEFVRLYGKPPSHFDGHQHQHLCANLLADGCLPQGAIVRRSFSFWPGEKGALNRLCRRLLDGVLGRRQRMTDYFLDLSQYLAKGAMQRVYELARVGTVELMTHPIRSAESDYLLSAEHEKGLSGLVCWNFAVMCRREALG